uniref:GMC_oxred_C domain-containing protein n=1 Tax=Steinernema glaseri TaxID=37863 RepID=A0A1I7Z1Q6_9BILA
MDITPTLKFSSIKAKFYSKLTENLKDDCPLYMKLALLDYKSAGKVEITSTDPTKQPLIDPMFLTANEDVENFLKALQQLKKLLDLPEFGSLKLRLAEKQTHDCAGDEWSEEFLICMIRNRFGTRSQSHTSTCRIGNSTANGVVDSQLRVFGVQNLRVVDASVLPSCMAPIGALPTVIILAERASDIIKQTYA